MNIKEAYKSYRRDHLGISDHNLILLRPLYVQKLRREQVVTKEIKQWNTESTEQLQDCFDQTNWDLFYDNCSSTDELVDTVSCYIKFCEDITIPTKTVRCYPNNKPWINKDIKQKLVLKKKLLQSHNRTELKLIQKQLDSEIKACK